MAGGWASARRCSQIINVPVPFLFPEAPPGEEREEQRRTAEKVRRRAMERQIAATGQRIDRLVSERCTLTKVEIKIVEKGNS
jgi:hypothetical protein